MKITVIRQIFLLVVLISCLVSCAHEKEQEIEFQMSYISNGNITIGVNLKGGGQISYLSYNNGPNLIDNYDYGREIQFTLRDEKSQGPGYEQEWNPTQGGHAFEGSGVISYSNDGHVLDTVTQPYHFLDWTGRSNVIMHQRISFYSQEVILVELELDYLDAQTRFGCHEWPAAYLTTNHTNLHYYEGATPWTADLVTSLSVVSSIDHPSHTGKPTENWASLTDGNDSGVTLWTPDNIDFITYMYVRGENSVAHFALRKCTELVPGETYTYAYYLIPGNYQLARELIYSIEQETLNEPSVEHP